MKNRVFTGIDIPTAREIVLRIFGKIANTSKPNPNTSHRNEYSSRNFRLRTRSTIPTRIMILMTITHTCKRMDINASFANPCRLVGAASLELAN